MILLLILLLIVRNIKKLSGINRHNCATIVWHNYKMKGIKMNIMKKKKATKKDKKELRDYNKYIVPFFKKGYSITDMFRIKNMARHTVTRNS